MRRSLAIFASLCSLMIGIVAMPATPASAAATTVCTLTPGREAVYRYDGVGTSWTQIGGPAAWLYGGGFGLFATTPDRSQIVRYLAPWWWQSIGDSGLTWAVTNDSIYGLSPGATSVWKWTGSPWWWTQVGEEAGMLYGGGAGLFATTPDGTGISRHLNSFFWQFLGSPDSPPRTSRTYVVTGADIYNLSSGSRLRVWHADGTTTGRWDPVNDISYRWAYGGNFGLVGLEENGDLVRIVGGSRQRIATNGSPFTTLGADVAITDDAVYVATPERDAVWKWTGQGQNWVRIGNGAARIVPCP